jgi:hypothetical protein
MAGLEEKAGIHTLEERSDERHEKANNLNNKGWHGLEV